jgi:hypothetical protein
MWFIVRILMSQSASDSFRNVTRYLGQDYRFAPTYIRPRAPTPNDVKPKEQQGFYPINSFWSNSVNNDLWVLIGFYNSPVQARWVLLTQPTTAAILDIGVPNGTTPIAPDINGLVNFTSTGGSVTITGTAGGTGAQNINFDLSTPALLPWTPTLDGSTPGTTIYSVNGQKGTYRVFQGMVFAQFFVIGTSATGTGNLVIGGLPISANASAGNCYGTCVDTNFTWPMSTTSICLQLIGGNSSMLILASGSGAAFGAVQISNTSFNVQGSIFYPI